jgi:amino acid transporter
VPATAPAPSLTTHARDAGLVRSIGPFALFASFFGMLLGSAIFILPATMAAAVGPWAWAAYLGCGAAVAAVLICFAEASARVPTSGGVGGFVDAAFGPYWGFVTNSFNWASMVVAAGAIAAAAFDTLGTVIPMLSGGPGRAIGVAAWFAMLVAINARGAHVGARFAATATSIKVVPVLVFILVGIWFITPANLTLPLAGGHADIGRAAILGIFLFTGAESGLSICGEVRDPARTVPRALIGAIFLYALVCVAVQIIAQGLLGNALGTSEAPLADGMRLVSPGLGGLLLAGTVISMLGWTFADALASPRLLFAMARDGVLPAPIGRLTETSRAPVIACITHAGIAAGLAITGSFESLVIVSTLFCIAIYFIGTLAALKLRAAGTALAGPPVRIPGLPAIALFGLGVMAWVTAQSTRNELLACIAVVAVATLLYRFRRAPTQAPFAAS